MTKNAVSLQKATFSYPKNGKILHYPEVKLTAGELCLITGANGSGKTTMLKLCCGILRAEGSSLEIFGQCADDWSLGKIGRYIGYVFQEPSRQLFCATVWDELTFAGAMRGEETEQLQKKALQLLEKFDLMPLMRRSTYKLSRGEKQRLAIAAVLMNDIKYLMLDEPTTGLDAESRQSLYACIRELLDDGVGIAIISHNRELIEGFSQYRIIKMGEGGQIL